MRHERLLYPNSEKHPESSLALILGTECIIICSTNQAINRCQCKSWIYIAQRTIMKHLYCAELVQ